MNEFFAMGGYGAYVWSGYVATILGLAAAIGFVWRRYAQARAKLAEASQAS